jgi:hypothetical protein
VTHVNLGTFAARFAIPDQVFVLDDDQIGLWVLTGAAKDKFDDEGVKKFPEFISVVSAVYDITIRFFVEGGLST